MEPFSRHRHFVFRRLLPISLACAVAAMAGNAFAQQVDDSASSADYAMPDSGAQPGDAIPPTAAAPNPPDRVARLSVVEGDASVEQSGTNQFSPATLNTPLTSGDLLYTGDGSMAELETGQTLVDLGGSTEVRVTEMSDRMAEFALTGGSVRLRAFSIAPGTAVELDTPNAAVTLLQPSDIRVDTDPNSFATTLSVLSGQVEVDGNNYQHVVNAGENLALKGLNPLQAATIAAPQPDALDDFASGRDEQFASAEQQNADNVNDQTVGAEDLADYGDWSVDNDDEPVWFPSSVAVGWVPYRYGHWIWLPPWGWTWVESEPWGFAPFHYGRWERLGGRWGWLPGPHFVAPVWAPALVVFFGGSLTAADSNHAALTAWAPLGPGEPFVPWYHANGLYTNRVNAANIFSRDHEAVEALYRQQTLDPSFSAGAGARSFVYRKQATTAVPQTIFASGRRVASANVRLSAQQLKTATVLARPDIAPIHEPKPLRAIPPAFTRPVVTANNFGKSQTGGAGYINAGPRSYRQTPQVQHRQTQPATHEHYQEHFAPERAPAPSSSSSHSEQHK